MQYLLDTHVLLWMRENDPRLKRKKWEPVFYDEGNEILFSVVSIWEIAIKRRLGKLKLEGSLEDFSRTLQTDHGFHLLSLEVIDISRVEKLPHSHRDPFDLLLIGQAIERGATAVTNDPRWKQYPVKTAW
jgi:PIN domain nuclease of toxin-antitoxin system